eukprot:TRINITY_DN314_c0_g1_i7.p1 TRINITY_DN314_c0_g1~~TRINITY_DN314_c0_g1_i7.p1  ORF type:complete len:213 (+),score=9.28 TRINITY_DN314_c0_g1_i7:571-1209(+)
MTMQLALPDLGGRASPSKQQQNLLRFPPRGVAALSGLPFFCSTILLHLSHSKVSFLLRVFEVGADCNWSAIHAPLQRAQSECSFLEGRSWNFLWLRELLLLAELLAEHHPVQLGSIMRGGSSQRAIAGVPPHSRRKLGPGIEPLTLRVHTPRTYHYASAPCDVFFLKVAGMYTFCKELVEVELRSLGTGVARELPQAYAVAKNVHMTFHWCG